MLHHPSKKIYHSSYNILLGNLSSSLQSIFICQGAQGTGVTTCDYFSQARTQMVSLVKKASFLNGCTGRHILRQGLCHDFTGRTIKLQEREDYWLVFLSKAQSCGHLQLGLQSCKGGQRTLLCHSPLGLGLWQHGRSL